METIIKLFEQMDLFKSFSPEELKKLLELGQIREYAGGEVIIHFGEPGKYLGIIVSGKAEASIVETSGQRRRLGLLEPGDFFGETSLLTGEPTNADVIALEASNVFLVPQDDFSPFLAVNQDAVRTIARTITKRLLSRQEDEDEQARVESARRSASDPYGLELSPSTAMRILVLNSGSSSLKFSYYDTNDPRNNCRGLVERIGLDDSNMIFSSPAGRKERKLGKIGYEKAIKAVVDVLTDPSHGVLKNLDDLTAVGHRVVHGGDKYGGAVLVNDQVLAEIEKNSVLAPLHNPYNLLGIKEFQKLTENIPQVAVFDTGFHQKMPVYASIYGLPYEFYEKDRIRRYGFHGISHHYVGLQAAVFLKRDFQELKLVTCHLGNGASVCAIDHGKSVDTSMGLTPLEGLIMGTRCGDLDPSIVFHLCREKGLSLEEVENILNRQSGVAGISGVSSDFRELETATAKQNSRALLAVHAFCYRLRKYIGAYTAAMGGLDALVFTGGIGEGSHWVRSLSCQGLQHLNIRVNDDLNKTVSSASIEVKDISEGDSLVKILVIPTDEARMIARETVRVLGYRQVDQMINRHKKNKVPIEISAHHIHLAKKEVEFLFGPEHQLKPRAELSQPGQFACEETLSLIGPKGRVERVRILGPMRKESQVEISMTEEFKLGIQAPIRASGDLDRSPGIVLEGPEGTCTLQKGVICSYRHIHMSPEDALSFGLKDRDIVMVEVKGERTLIFGDVLVRVHPDFRLSMHIDTDEANAASITTGMEGIVLGLQDRK